MKTRSNVKRGYTLYYHQKHNRWRCYGCIKKERACTKCPYWSSESRGEKKITSKEYLEQIYKLDHKIKAMELRSQEYERLSYSIPGHSYGEK